MVGEEGGKYGARWRVARREGGIRGVSTWVELEGRIRWVGVCVGGRYEYI